MFMPITALQAKASSSRSQLQKSSIPRKPAESNIPKLRKLETVSVNEARLPHAPRKRSEIVEGAARNCTKELNISDVKSEQSMQIDNKQMAGVEVECDSLDFEKISKQAQVELENNLEHVNLKSKEQGELYESENVSSMENVLFTRHNKKLHWKGHTHEQLDKEADHHPLDDKLYDVLSNGDQSLFQEPQSMHYHSMQRTSNNISNTCDGPTFNENLVLQVEHGTFKDGRHSGEFKEYNSGKTALLNSSLVDFSKTVPGGSIQGIQCKNTGQVNGRAGDFGKCGGDAQVHLFNGNLSINCNETQSNLEAVDQQLQGGQLETPDPSIVREISSQNENECNVHSCQLVHVTTLCSKGSPEKSILGINGGSESESKIAEVKDCQLPVNCQSGFIPRRPVDEEYDQFIDSKAMHDRTQAFEVDRLSEDCITVSATACRTKVADVSPEKIPFSENNIKNLHFTSHLCPTVKADMSINNHCTISESHLRDDNFSRDTSMHCDVRRNVPGNFEQQASMFTYPEINEVLCEDESLVPNYGHLLHQGEFSEVSADFISNTKDSIGSGAENPSGLLQQTLLAQSVQEFDHTSGEIQEAQEEDARAQSFDENPVAYDCSNKHCLAVTNDQFLLADDNNINEDSHLSGFQKPSAVVNDSLHLNGDWLPTNIASSEEIKDKKSVEGAFEGCSIHTSAHNASNLHDVNERAELLQIDYAKEGSLGILPLVEVQLNDNVISAEFDSSTKVSEDPLTKLVAWKSEEQCSLSENSVLLASDNLSFNSTIPQGSEVSSLNSKGFSDEAETDIFVKDFPNADMLGQTKGDINYAEDSNKIVKL